jgi:hypothetical protein
VARLPRVVSPIRTLFTREGIEIALISVELWPTRLVVRLAALPSETAAERLRQYEAEFERLGEAAARDPPEDPGTELLAGLQIAVDDNAGTTYTPRGSNTGGSGSEWHGDWFFVAEVPDAAERLAVRVSAPEGATATVHLDVAGF